MVSTPSIIPEQNPDRDPLIYGLAARRAEQAGLIARLEQELTEAKQALIHLDAVLVMMGVDNPSASIRVKKATTAGLFHAKELPRMIRTALKGYPDGATSWQLAAIVADRKGWGATDERFINVLAEKITRLMCEWRRQGRISGGKGEGGRSVWMKIV